MFAFVWLLSQLLPVREQAWSRQNQPRFEDFPVAKVWRGAPAVPKRIVDYRYPDLLAKAAKEGVNFAGRYKFALWMGGSNCAAGAIIDLPTGGVFIPPLGKRTEDRDESGQWLISCGMYEGSAIEFQLHSRLVKIRTGMTAPPDTYYFVWEQDRFRRILFLGHACSRPKRLAQFADEGVELPVEEAVPEASASSFIFSSAGWATPQ
ncbi:MAG: hypothetical protein K2X03_14025 [Bryobacteraceae bacterium]|nr:hypothetical protein [Bryobacteraceae bacterium]